MVDYFFVDAHFWHQTYFTRGFLQLLLVFKKNVRNFSKFKMANSIWPTDFWFLFVLANYLRPIYHLEGIMGS